MNGVSEWTKLTESNVSASNRKDSGAIQPVKFIKTNLPSRSTLWTEKYKVYCLTCVLQYFNITLHFKQNLALCAGVILMITATAVERFTFKLAADRMSPYRSYHSILISFFCIISPFLERFWLYQYSSFQS